jgi:hypothetical protein
MNGREIDGRKLVCEFAKDPSQRATRGGRGGSGYRIRVENMDARTSWQANPALVRCA